MNLQLVIIVGGLLATIATSLWGIHQNNSRGDRLEERLDAKIDTLRTEVNQRFDSVNQRFDSFQHEVNQRFDGVNQRFDSFQREVNQRFDGLQRDFNQFYLMTGKLEGRIDTIEKRPS
jgi:DNA anti-recombination protein RmuC